MPGGYVSILNASSRTSDADVQSYIPDLQAQASSEFWWYWGIDPYIDQNGSGSPIIIVDYPGPNDPAGALGYHWVDQYDNPFAVIFSGLCQDYGYNVCGVISHELMEMQADQLAITTALWDFGDGTGIIVLQEVADPVEQALYAGAVNGNPVSDFVTPEWYSPIGSWPYDALGYLATPLTLLSGGSYVSYQSVTLSGWEQAFADKAEGIHKAAVAVRSQLRPNPHQETVNKLREKQPLAAVQAGAGPKQGGQPRTLMPNGTPSVASLEDLPEHLRQAQKTAQEARAGSPVARSTQLPAHLKNAAEKARQRTASNGHQQEHSMAGGPRVFRPANGSQD